MKISFVIPCYKSEKTIESVVEEILKMMKNKNEFIPEIVMVSDSSPDGVFLVIKEICNKYPAICKGIELSKNFGQHAALMAGYSCSSGDVIFSLDDDGQAPIESIFQMIGKVTQENFDCCFGAYKDKKHSLFRNFGSRINDKMAEILLGKPKTISVTSFFCVKRYVIDEVLKYKNSYPYILGLILRVTRKVCNVNVQHRERLVGKSGYTFWGLLGLWMNGFTAFSIKPLRIATIIGALCSFLGLIIGVLAIINKIFINNDTPLGYTSTIVVILFLGGCQMLILGLIGEYVGRIYVCSNNAPQFVIKERVNI